MQQRLSRGGRILPLTAATAAFFVWLNHYQDVYSEAADHPPLSRALQRSSSLLAAVFSAAARTAACEQRRDKLARFKASNSFSTEPTIRTGNTPADAYFRKCLQIPEPAIKHAFLPPINKGDTERSGILVIGDVHGCYDELLLLYEKAVAENHGRCFHYVILVGDLCNKGPQSAAVIRHVRLADRWLSIRGNHENGALRAALGDPNQLKKAKYQWMVDTLSDEDVQWMAQLPYTIRIPGSVFDETVDTIIVHAGLVPGVELEQQSIKTMVTVREVQRESSVVGEPSGSASWASLWKGPEQIIFGHDAKRGLQQYEFATGLDTGAVYGKQLTGIILPERKLVQIDSLEAHCPIGSD